MLEACDLSVRFGNSMLAVDRASLQVCSGQVLALCGPNGAGKSTLLSVLAGDLQPNQGAALLDGRPVSSWRPADLARRRAVLEQQPGLSGNFTVAQLAALSVGIEASPERMMTIISEALADVGLSGRADYQVNRLSGGQRHRAHLARVLSQLASASDTDGQYLLLDEPTSGLDLVHQLAVMSVARRVAARGVGVLVVLHDLNLAAAFCDRIGLMKEGRMVAMGPPDTVLTNSLLSGVYSTEVRVIPRDDGFLNVQPVYPAHVR